METLWSGYIGQLEELEDLCRMKSSMHPSELVLSSFTSGCKTKISPWARMWGKAEHGKKGSWFAASAPFTWYWSLVSEFNSQVCFILSSGMLGKSFDFFNFSSYSSIKQIVLFELGSSSRISTWNFYRKSNIKRKQLPEQQLHQVILYKSQRASLMCVW